MFTKGKNLPWPDAQSGPMRAQLSHFFTSQPEMAKVSNFDVQHHYGNDISYPDYIEYFDWPLRPLEAVRGY